MNAIMAAKTIIIILYLNNVHSSAMLTICIKRTKNKKYYNTYTGSSMPHKSLNRKQELLRGVEAGRTARSVGQRNTWVGNRTFLEARSVVGEEGC